MNAAVAQKPYEVPEGGLASFLTATSGSWSDEALTGLDYEIIRPAANELAEFGREGDNRIAHVADGETVIPMEVFEEDPALKAALFDRMREMGIEPERYVVGNELNSINPVTGQPEFFLKKLFKGIKKAVKGVVKVFKKIAPIVLSVGLNFLFPGLGAIAAGALGSGIGTLVQGGNLKDAFKAALSGGAVGGISSGIGSVMKGGDFMSGVKGALPGGAPGAPVPIETGVPDVVTETATASATPSVAEAALQEGMATAAPVTPAGATAGVMEEVVVTAPRLPDPAAGNYLLGPGAAGAAGAKEAATTGAKEAAAETVSKGIPIEGIGDITEAARKAVDPGFFASVKNFFTTGDIGHLKQAFLPGSSASEILEKLKNAGFEVSKDQAAAIAEELTPGLMRKTLPTLATTYALGKPLGLFDPQPMPEPYDFFGGMTREDYIRMYPERYGYTPIGRDEHGNLLPSRPGGAKDGGDISHFPRKNGRISGPGTETSDDIPAMLSDGEFVMTARAVRGAGDGSRKNGMKKMYQMMKTFEGRAARG